MEDIPTIADRVFKEGAENPENISKVMLEYANQSLSELGLSDDYKASISIEKNDKTDARMDERMERGLPIEGDESKYDMADYFYILSLENIKTGKSQRITCNYNQSLATLKYDIVHRDVVDMLNRF